MTAALAFVFALQGVAPEAAPVPAPPAAYGDQGTSHVGLVLGLGGGDGGFAWAAGANYGYFVFDGVAPGVDVLASGGTHLRTSGLALGTLRLVPIRTRALSVYVIGRAGRVLIADHEDGWGAGGGAGAIFFTGGRIGFEVAYDILQLMPDSFCADLSQCRMQGLRIGIVAGF